MVFSRRSVEFLLRIHPMEETRRDHVFAVTPARETGDGRKLAGAAREAA